jgi:protein O-mannosyl-transferase
MLNKINTRPDRQRLIIYIVLTVLTLAVFWQVNQFDFINFDDNVYVTENNHIKSRVTLSNLSWAFSTRYADMWNPLVWLSFILDYKLYGMNAGGYHLTNLILHILSTLLLFWLFCRMTKEIWPSAFVAACFAIHPFHVESVAWIAERKDVLIAFFWMLTLCLYVYYTEKPTIKTYMLVVFSFVLALMSKPFAIYLPVIMILLDYWPLKRFVLKKDQLFWQIKEKAPLVILAIITFIINLYISIYNTSSPELVSQAYPLTFRLANASLAFITYLGKTVWPYDMAIFYPFLLHISVWQTLGAGLLIIFITLFVILMTKRMPYLLVGWLWFTTMIIPIIVMTQTSKYYFVADRYHYLSSIGIATMMAWGIPPLMKNQRTGRAALWSAGITFLAFMALLSWQQCRYWKNSLDLWNHTLSVTKNNYLAHNNISQSLIAKGEIEKAIQHYNEAINIVPKYAFAYNNRGLAYLKYLNVNRTLGCSDLQKACSYGYCKGLGWAKGKGYCP